MKYIHRFHYAVLLVLIMIGLAACELDDADVGPVTPHPDDSGQGSGQGATLPLPDPIDSGQGSGQGATLPLPDPIDDPGLPVSAPLLALSDSDELNRLHDLPAFTPFLPWAPYWEILDRDAYQLQTQSNALWPHASVYLRFTVTDRRQMAQVTALQYGPDRQQLPLAQPLWVRPDKQAQVQLAIDLTTDQWAALCPVGRSSVDLYLSLAQSSQTPRFLLGCESMQDETAGQAAVQRLNLGATLPQQPELGVSYWLVDADLWQQPREAQQLQALLAELAQTQPDHLLCVLPYRVTTTVELLPCSSLERADTLSLTQQWQRWQQAQDSDYRSLSFMVAQLEQQSHAKTLFWLPSTNLALTDYQSLTQLLAQPASRLLSLQHPQTQAQVSVQLRRLSRSQWGGSYFWQPQDQASGQSLIHAAHDSRQWSELLADLLR